MVGRMLRKSLPASVDWPFVSMFQVGSTVTSERRLGLIALQATERPK